VTAASRFGGTLTTVVVTEKRTNHENAFAML
jgi:hypothetical protein